MPTYEYACKACGEHLEVVQSFRDDPLTECPHCGGELRKVFGAIGIAFKGSGFYKTDSRPQEGKEGKGKVPQEKAQKAPKEPKEKAASADGGSGDKAKTSTSDSKSAASS